MLAWKCCNNWLALLRQTVSSHIICILCFMKFKFVLGKTMNSEWIKGWALSKITQRQRHSVQWSIRITAQLQSSTRLIIALSGSNVKCHLTFVLTAAADHHTNLNYLLCKPLHNPAQCQVKLSCKNKEHKFAFTLIH